MFYRLCLAVVVPLAVAIADVPSGVATIESDPAKGLQGDWEVVAITYKGNVEKLNGNSERMRFDDGRYWYTTALRQGEYRFFGKGNPCTIRAREIDIENQFDHTTTRALYELKDGNLRIVWRERGDARPTNFDAVADPNLTLCVLKKVEPKSADKPK